MAKNVEEKVLLSVNLKTTELYTHVLLKNSKFLGCARMFCSRKSLSWTASPDFVQESRFLGLRRPISFKKVTFLDFVSRFYSRK